MYEICDPVEDVPVDVPVPFRHGRKKGVAVVTLCDFVLPSWFTRGSKEPFSFRGAVGGPFEITKGGYFAPKQGPKVFGTDMPAWKKELKNAHGRVRRAVESLEKKIDQEMTLIEDQLRSEQRYIARLTQLSELSRARSAVLEARWDELNNRRRLKASESDHEEQDSD